MGYIFGFGAMGAVAYWGALLLLYGSGALLAVGAVVVVIALYYLYKLLDYANDMAAMLYMLGMTGGAILLFQLMRASDLDITLRHDNFAVFLLVWLWGTFGYILLPVCVFLTAYLADNRNLGPTITLAVLWVWVCVFYGFYLQDVNLGVLG